ncbi:hypothetical protein GQX73_g5478 [Xylaria multiplex]|uniref:Uncharacterized protein n=1 Tax=Xylaria multiplex TaxID=323545 RepID=A0A7C8IN98_9PEZI|nr:hypothetical protein GQX73_g5478 [Xylaria multiplex]
MAICNSPNPLMPGGVSMMPYNPPAHYLSSRTNPTVNQNTSPIPHNPPAHYLSSGIKPIVNQNTPSIPYDYRPQAVPDREQDQSKEPNTCEVACPSYQDSSPRKPQVPVAHMSPTLPEENPQPNVVNKEYQAYAQNAEQEQVYSSDDSHDDDVAVLCTPETGMSESSSDTSNVLAREQFDGAANGNGNDGVIDHQPTAYNGNGHQGVDIYNSLHIGEHSGRIHLGSQWQVPEASTARSNAGPEFGEAREWIACKNERSADDPGSELIDVYCDKAVEAELPAPSHGADTSAPKDILRLRNMRQAERAPIFCGFYRGPRGPKASSAPTNNVVGSTEAAADSSAPAIRACSIPTDLSMSGALRSVLSGTGVANLEQASKIVGINRFLLSRTPAWQPEHTSQ